MPPKAARQRAFPFLERSDARRRRFRRAIVAATVLAAGLLLGATRPGRYLVARLGWAGHAAARTWLGFPDDPTARAADRRLRREFGVAMTQRLLERVDGECSPPMRAFLRQAGMAPDDRILRWGNFDGVLLLSSRVFQNDDTGRSYRQRPGVRSVWLRNIVLPRGLAGFFLVPDDPETLHLARVCGAQELPESVQTTNSWGCRGPEPNPHAALRGLVLGDSFMQGLFVGDDQTPPAQLQRILGERTGRAVSILNTGHLGYSPEQYHAALMEYAERFPPHFVVLSVCGNDFGGEDWTESTAWLELIWQFCRTREIPCLTVPVPDNLQVTANRRIARFQGRLAGLARVLSYEYLNPTEEFVEAHLRRVNAGLKEGRVERSSPLYNGHLDDGHFSPLGAEVWAQAVARRLALILERRETRQPPQSPTPTLPARKPKGPA